MSLNIEHKCHLCDWSDDNSNIPFLGPKLNLFLPSGFHGVYCQIFHRVKAKDDGKYCKNFIKKKSL